MGSATWQITLPQLSSFFEEPIGLSNPHADVVSQAVTDAYALARAAFEQSDPAARLFAERAMHVIQTRSHFAPPMHAIPAAYWNVLIRHKLASELKVPGDWAHLVGDAEELTRDELSRRLQVAVQDFGCHNHPMIDLIGSEQGNRALLVFAKNWYGSCQGFASQLVQLVQRTSGRVRQSVAENVEDEFAGVSHDELRQRFIESIGFAYDSGSATTDADRVPESYAIMSYRTGVCLINNTLYALGSFYTTEANWPLECVRMLTALRRRGCSEHDLEYWTTHAHADEDHAAEWLEVLIEATTTPSQRREVLTAALAQLHLRRRMYDSMLALATR